MTDIKKWFWLSITIFMALFFLFRSELVSASVISSLSLCAKSLIPSLFPFFVLSNFAIRAGIFPPSPFLLGAVGGYPLGVSIICDLYRENRLSKDDAERLMPACSLCGMGFMLGAVSSVFGSFYKGLFLWAVHILSALPLCLFSPKPPVAKVSPLPPAVSFTKGVRQGLFSCLNVCAYVVFFGILCDLVPPYLSGFLEMSRGVFETKNMAFTAFYTAFGGLCVHFQAASLCHDAGLSAKKHFFGKLLHGVLSFLLVLFLTFFLK